MIEKAAVYPAAFLLWSNFTTRCRKVQMLDHLRGCALGNLAESQELIKLGNRIRDRRREIRLSQEKVAEKAGVSTNTISRIEGGQSAMSIEIFIKLVEILDMDANRLLGIVALPEEDRQCQELFCGIRYLKKGDQKVVLKTVKALIEELRRSR